MAAGRNKQLVVFERGQVSEAKAPPYKVGHFSHRHWLYRFQVQPRDDFECAICEQPCQDMVYGCKTCSYYMHEPCYSLPQKINLGCHRHSLTLSSTPVYDNGEFKCNACGGDGEGFNYNCFACNYDIHVSCASLPKTLTTGFNYQISLYYSFPNKNEAAPLFCHICKQSIDKKNWMYYNRATDFVYHVYCAIQQRFDGQDIEDLVAEASDRLKNLELKK